MNTTILITGANSGIGFETAKTLLQQGYAVILACRTLQKAKAAKEKLVTQFNALEAKTGVLEMDLASCASIKTAVENIPESCWGLICNAAVSYSGPARYTEDGIEETFGVNHLGHFLLVSLLLKKQGLKRITVVSSAGHDPAAGTPFPAPDLSDLNRIAFPPDPQKSENGNLRYANSKLCNILFTYELVRKLAEQNQNDIVVNAYNPGMVPGTGLARNRRGIVPFLWKYVLPLFNRLVPRIRTLAQVQKELSHLATTMPVNGKYVDKTTVKSSSRASYDEAKAMELWDFSRSLASKFL